MFPGLTPGQDYNTSAQIIDQVTAIAGLLETFGPAGLRIHATMLDCRDENGEPTIPTCDELEQAYDIDSQAARMLMTNIARRGCGSYREFDEASQIEFIDLVEL